jgi:hypothetical protein
MDAPQSNTEFPPDSNSNVEKTTEYEQYYNQTSNDNVNSDQQPLNDENNSTEQQQQQRPSDQEQQQIQDETNQPSSTTEDGTNQYAGGRPPEHPLKGKHRTFFIF